MLVLSTGHSSGWECLKGVELFSSLLFAVVALTCVKSDTGAGTGKNPGSPNQKNQKIINDGTYFMDGDRS